MSVAPQANFDPGAIRAFQFTYRSMQPDGTVRLGYALDDLEFEETLELPAPTHDSRAVESLLDLLHWVAGVSYYKAAIPQHLVCETGAPPAAAGLLLSALYSEGLGEFAVVNDLLRLPQPQFPRGVDSASQPSATAAHGPTRLLVPVGGGKDSCVAIEIARASGLEVALFSIGDATADPRHGRGGEAASPPGDAPDRPGTAGVELAGRAQRAHPDHRDRQCVALLTAATQGFDAVALANERIGVGRQPRVARHRGQSPVQQEPARRAAAAGAVAEIAGAPLIFSILRPASELSIARAFSRMHAVPLGVHEL